MAELKTQRNDGDVDSFLASVDNPKRRRDALVVRELMADVTGEEPAMWGTSIVGYGTHVYKPKSGGALHEWMKVGFSPRKQSLTLYIMDGFGGYETLLSHLGPHSTGKSCLYIKDLNEIDMEILREMIEQSVRAVETRAESQQSG